METINIPPRALGTNQHVKASTSRNKTLAQLKPDLQTPAEFFQYFPSASGKTCLACHYTSRAMALPNLRKHKGSIGPGMDSDLPGVRKGFIVYGKEFISCCSSIKLIRDRN